MVKRKLNQSLLTISEKDAGLNLSSLNLLNSSRNHDMSAVLLRSQESLLSHEKKVKEAQKKAAKDEKAACTFKPAINKNANKLLKLSDTAHGFERKRSTGKRATRSALDRHIIAKEKVYAERRAKNHEKIRKEEERDFFVPRINKSSVESVIRRNLSAAREREQKTERLAHSLLSTGLIDMKTEVAKKLDILNKQLTVN